jgi:transcription initiation factor TFIIH subunit 2
VFFNIHIFRVLYIIVFVNMAAFQCSVCSLQLNSSSHIARSHHHLFPVPLFIECKAGSNELIDGDEKSSCVVLDMKESKVDCHETCFGCQEVLTSSAYDKNSASSSGSQVLSKSITRGNKMTLQCPRCRNVFCVECDIFIHDSLHNCPGCYLD